MVAGQRSCISRIGALVDEKPIQAMTGCPVPPRPVRAAGEQLMIARYGSAEERQKLGPIHLLPRPWLPHTCHPRLLSHLLMWLDEVAGWLTHDYSWRITTPIPSCWPEHPHIVHELAVLAWLRLLAEDALDVAPVEDWHRYALPSFANRLTERLGTGCTNGHDPWPTAPRHAAYRAESSVDARQDAFTRLLAAHTRGWGRRRPAPSFSEADQLELPSPLD